MFALDSRLALIVAIVPPAVGAVSRFATRPLRPAARRAQEKTADLGEQLQENLAGMREVVAFGGGHAQSRRFGSTLDELLQLRMRVALIDTAFQSGRSLFSLAVTLVILGYGGYLVLRGQTTIGTLFAIRTFFGYLSQNVGQLSGLVTSIQKARASGDRIAESFDLRPAVAERATARAPGTVRGAITFEQVSFAYDADRPVLHSISLTARPGEMVALVGPSGAGRARW